MMDKLKRFFGNKTDQSDVTGGSEHDVRVAVSALCIEMARIDNRFTGEELDTLVSILQDKYHVSADHVQALMQEADRELEESVDLWQFARLINDNYSIDEKIAIIEMLWQIVYVDGKMDEQEHYLIGKLSNLLRLSHNQLIDAKLKVLHGR